MDIDPITMKFAEYGLLGLVIGLVLVSGGWFLRHLITHTIPTMQESTMSALKDMALIFREEIKAERETYQREIALDRQQRNEIVQHILSDHESKHAEAMQEIRAVREMVAGIRDRGCAARQG